MIGIEGKLYLFMSTSHDLTHQIMRLGSQLQIYLVSSPLKFSDVTLTQNRNFDIYEVLGFMYFECVICCRSYEYGTFEQESMDLVQGKY